MNVAIYVYQPQNKKLQTTDVSALTLLVYH